MGKLLESFCETAFFMRFGTSVDTAMYNLLKMEKHFEFEKDGIRHADIEYIWYVKLEKDGYDISYTEINHQYDKLEEIEDETECEAKYIEIFDSILNATKGEKHYA